MANKLITLRKISSGGLLILPFKSAKDMIKARNLDPSEWEEVETRPESEDQNLGDNQGDAGAETD